MTALTKTTEQTVCAKQDLKKKNNDRFQTKCGNYTETVLQGNILGL